MKYRVRLDMSFEQESDARALLESARGLSNRSVNMNEGKENEEIAYFDLEMCRHDEGLPCTRLERTELRTGERA